MCSMILAERPIVVVGKGALCRVTIRPITNRKSEHTDTVCFLSLSVFDPLSTLLSLLQLASALSGCSCLHRTHAMVASWTAGMVWSLYSRARVECGRSWYFDSVLVESLLQLTVETNFLIWSYHVIETVFHRYLAREAFQPYGMWPWGDLELPFENSSIQIGLVKSSVEWFSTLDSINNQFNNKNYFVLVVARNIRTHIQK